MRDVTVLGKNFATFPSGFSMIRRVCLELFGERLAQIQQTLIFKTFTLHSPKPGMLRHLYHRETVMILQNTSIGARLLASVASVLLIGFWGSFPARAADAMMTVYMDHARVLKLDRPVSKVIIGNSDVADATVADAKTIVLTGRSFGTTNIVILDTDGNAIVDERILVSIDEGNTVRVFRQTNRSVLSCTPNCEVHAVQKAAAN